MDRRIFALLLCCVMLCSFAATAFGAGSPDQEEHAARQPDYSRKGSVTVDILTADGTPVPGGSLSAYLVAPAREDDGNNDFVYVEPFGTAGEVVDADSINAAESGAPAIAAALAAKTGSASPAATEQVDDSGRAVFSGLTLGLYLIVQEQTAPGFDPVRSFLVTVPMWDGKQLLYDVNANPKPSISYERPTLDPPVKKSVVVVRGAPNPSEPFFFRMTPKQKDAPMPVNADATVDPDTGAMTIRKAGGGEVEFGVMSFGVDDVGKTYTYVVEEVAGINKLYAYETRIYTMTVVVTMTGGVIGLDVSYVCSHNKTVDEMVFTNVYTDTSTPPPTLPQAGQHWWHITLLAGLGLGIFLLGWYLNRRSGKDAT